MSRKQRPVEEARRAGAAPAKISRSRREIFADALAHHQNGQLKEAEHLYWQILESEPRHADSLHQLGAIAYQLGRHGLAVDLISRAITINPDAALYHSNLGLFLQAQGKLAEATACHRHAAALAPNVPEILNNLGVSLWEEGRLDEAVTSYCRALDLRPEYAEAHNNLGNALKDQGQLDEAAECCRKAIGLKPDFADAHNNLGNVLRQQGRFDDAASSYRRALNLRPNYPEAQNNMSLALAKMNRLDDATRCCLEALRIKPDYVNALNTLALLYMAQGENIAALGAIQRSLKIAENTDAKSLFVHCIRKMSQIPGRGEIRQTVVRALNESWARPSKLSRAGINLVMQAPDIGECVARAVAAWPRRLSTPELYEASGFTAVAGDPLLRALLGLAPICDPRMERFLTMARRILLEAAAEQSDYSSGVDLEFYGALARQCFINEYAFCHTDDEIHEAEKLRDLLNSMLEAERHVPALWILAVAAYFPLFSLPQSERLLGGQSSEPVVAVLQQQICEPAREAQLRAEISLITSIESKVSKAVKSQYEENPYPRWVKAELAEKPQPFMGYLSRKFPFNTIGVQGAAVELLIAGCGTGLHSIETARRLTNVRILAVDLSLTSLAFARRKTEEFGIESIEYAQADLLELESLGRTFDVIESVGVLHHLAEPFAGWRVLLSLLRPSGFMKLGLYSEIARRDIMNANAVIVAEGYGVTASEIRRCRERLMDNGADFKATVNAPDFFSISACRDMLFNSQEHRMTLTDIDAFLGENNLTFLGFEIGDDVSHAYRQRFPDDLFATNLARWQIFENENPHIFTGMYQFWVQRAI